VAGTSQSRRHAAKVAKILRQEYPNATCALDFRTPLELLVATILSAQCTDKRVNLVTKDLFQKYRSAADYARASQEALQRDIQSTGFFRNKAKSLIGCCTELVEKHGGEVPKDLDTLVGLPGIGRKTANVVLGTAFGIASGVVVDTHVARVSRRLGLTRHKDPTKIERDLMALIPQEAWIDFGHALVHHGRRLCVARKPKCDDCPLGPVCPRVGVEKGPLR
jgi:endonuclease-3